MVPLDSHVLAAHLQLYSGSLVWVFIFRERPRPTTTTSTVERWERRAVDTIERQVSTTATTIPPRVARLTGGGGGPFVRRVRSNGPSILSPAIDGEEGSSGVRRAPPSYNELLDDATRSGRSKPVVGRLQVPPPPCNETFENGATNGR